MSLDREQFFISEEFEFEAANFSFTEKVQFDKNRVAIVLVSLLIIFALILLGTPAIGRTDLIDEKGSNCNIRLLLLIDRSSSISVPSYGGSSDNVTAIKRAINDSDGLINAASGPYSKVHVVAFADRALNFTATWAKISTHDEATAVRSRVSSIPFKTTANTSQYGGDKVLEGRTNWEAGFNAGYNMTEKPTHVIIFTDGNPTTFVGDTSTDTVTNNQDLSKAVSAAQRLRSAGSIVYAVGVGNEVNVANLNAIATSNDRVYPGSYAGLKDRFRAAVSNMKNTCTPVTTSTSPNGSSTTAPNGSSTTVPENTTTTNPDTPTTTLPEPELIDPRTRITVDQNEVTVREGQPHTFNLRYYNDTTNARLLQSRIDIHRYTGLACYQLVNATPIESIPLGVINASSSIARGYRVDVPIGGEDELDYIACGIGVIETNPPYKVILDNADPLQIEEVLLHITVERIPFPAGDAAPGTTNP